MGSALWYGPILLLRSILRASTYGYAHTVDVVPPGRTASAFPHPDSYYSSSDRIFGYMVRKYSLMVRRFMVSTDTVKSSKRRGQSGLSLTSCDRCSIEPFSISSHVIYISSLNFFYVHIGKERVSLLSCLGCNMECLLSLFFHNYLLPTPLSCMLCGSHSSIGIVYFTVIKLLTRLLLIQPIG